MKHRINNNLGGPTGGFDGRLAVDIEEALSILKTVTWLDREKKREERAVTRQRAKIAAVSLQKTPWEGKDLANLIWAIDNEIRED